MSEIPEGKNVCFKWRGKPLFISSQDGQGDRAGGRRAAQRSEGPPTRPGQGEETRVGHPHRSLHSPGLRPHSQRRRFRRLLLPVSRLPLRCLRADQEGPGAAEPGSSRVRVCNRRPCNSWVDVYTSRRDSVYRRYPCSCLHAFKDPVFNILIIHHTRYEDLCCAV
ncbi:unnamed protein product [Staurois parvus]|uniref:Uncharacterized protein n=1 Tax=Staurois parvus TaxID=386267 RepID=A0ABN9BXK3_9NEOB|nr:unnamed protein product [Staurois parvus]